MELSKLETVAGELGCKIGMLDRGSFKVIAPDIDDDERVEYVATGLQGKSPAAIVVTDKYLYLGARGTGMIAENVCTTVKREKINGVSSGNGSLFASVKIDVQGHEYVIDKMAKTEASRLRKILS